MKTKATPSTARDAIMSHADVAHAPRKLPKITMAHPSSKTLLGPSFLANAPVGSDRKIPMAVNTDISHEPVDVVMSWAAMMLSKILGTLYCTMAMDVPTNSSTRLKTR